MQEHSEANPESPPPPVLWKTFT
eukprot:COSAG02_NODE_56572_length_285_cov_0.473118_2_plen_22_part_01